MDIPISAFLATNIPNLNKFTAKNYQYPNIEHDTHNEYLLFDPCRLCFFAHKFFLGKKQGFALIWFWV